MRLKQAFQSIVCFSLWISLISCAQVIDLLLAEIPSSQKQQTPRSNSSQGPLTNRHTSSSGLEKDEDTISSESEQGPLSDSDISPTPSLNTDNIPILWPNDSTTDSPSATRPVNKPIVIEGEFETLETPAQIEAEVYHKLMEYRSSLGLSHIRLSKGLSHVARIHSEDLSQHYRKQDAYPESTSEGICNLHSWSTSGDWSPCCYKRHDIKAECLWDKVKEILGIDAVGYEIASMYPVQETQRDIAGLHIENYKSSPPHHALMINQDEWSDNEWVSVGIGVAHSFQKGNGTYSDAVDSYLNIWFSTKEIP